MRLTIEDYAEALIGLTADKSEAETTALVAKFLQLLQRRRALSLLPRIVTALSERLQAERGEVSAQVKSARPLSKTLLADLTKLVKDRSGAETVVWQEMIDEKLISGGVINFQDRVIDFSCQNFLSKIKQTLIK